MNLLSVHCIYTVVIAQQMSGAAMYELVSRVGDEISTDYNVPSECHQIVVLLAK